MRAKHYGLKNMYWVVGGEYVVMNGVVLVEEVMGVWVVFYKNITELIK